MDVTVVLPVYNSADTLRLLVERIVCVLENNCADWEVVLINDGSSDLSWTVIKELAGDNARLQPINLSRNYGEHNATLCGIRAARYPIIVTLDDDLQNPPEEIAKLLHKLAEGFDVVYGSPREEQHGIFRDLASQLTKIVMQRSMGVEVARNISSFRAFRTRLRDAFASFAGDYPNIDVLLTWSAASYAAVKVNHLPRETGASSYNLERLIRHAMNMITGFSMVPLQFATMSGLVCMCFGLFLSGWAIVQWIANRTVTLDAAFFSGVILTFLALTMVAIGIVGEYLGRIYTWTIGKPSYSIKSIGLSDEEPAVLETLGVNK